jgi:hypothetical protein
MSRSLHPTVPVLLVTGYLGAPVTTETALQDCEQRFLATCLALQTLRRDATKTRILLAFTGDESLLNRIIEECNWPAHDASYFPQTIESIPFGKGLLEHQLISRALRHWQLTDIDALVVKLTAKYIVENLPKVLHFATYSSFPLYGWRHPGKRMIDSRCFFFRARAYESFSSQMDLIDDRQGYYTEHAIYDILSKLGIKAGLLCCRPLISGLSGSGGVPVRASKWKRYLVRCASLFFPGL